MKIAITGSTSAIGKVIAKSLEDFGHEVLRVGGSNSKIWRIGESWPGNLHYDILLHLAHDRNLSTEQNYQSCSNLVKTFPGRIIYLSSISAHKNSKSIYGRSKFDGETIINRGGGTSLRAGIILGDNIGGVFENLNTYVSKCTFLPLPFKGNSRLFLTHIDDLISEILHQLPIKEPGTFFVANSWPMTFRQILVEISKLHHKKIFFLPMPEIFTSILFIISNFLGIKIDSIDRLKSLQNEVTLEDLSKLKSPITKFEKNIKFFRVTT